MDRNPTQPDPLPVASKLEPPPDVLPYRGKVGDSNAAEPWYIILAAAPVYVGATAFAVSGLFLVFVLPLAGEFDRIRSPILLIPLVAGAGMLILEHFAFRRRHAPCAVAMAAILGLVALFLLVLAVTTTTASSSTLVMAVLAVGVALCGLAHFVWAWSLPWHPSV